MQYENARKLGDQELLDMLRTTVDRPKMSGIRMQWAIVLRTEIQRRGLQTES